MDVLVYDEKREHEYMGPLTDPEVLEMVGKKPKQFFWAWVPVYEPGMIELIRPAPWQDW